MQNFYRRWRYWFGTGAAPVPRSPTGQSRLYALIDQINDPIVVYVLNDAGEPGAFVEVNGAAVRLYGYTRDELLAMSPRGLVDPTVPLVSRIREIRDDEGKVVDSVHVTKDGRRIPVEVSAHVCDIDGRPGIISVCRDVTARRRSEARLMAEHEVTRIMARSSSLEEAAPAIMQSLCGALDATTAELWLVDEEAGVLRKSVSHACEQAEALDVFLAAGKGATLRSGQGLAGRVWRDREPSWAAGVTANQAFPRRDLAAAAGLRSGVAFPLMAGDEPAAVMVFFSRGTTPPDRPTLNTMAAIGSEVGQSIQRWRAERSIRESEERKAAILESALDCVITMDQHGRIVDFNPAAERTFGHPAADVIGRPLAEVVIPERLRGAHARGLAHLTDAGQGAMLGRRSEVQALHASGREFPVELAMSVTRLSGGEAFYTAYLRDITERKQREAALRQSEAEARALATEREAILGQIADGVVIADSDGRVVFFNGAAKAMHGVDRLDVRPVGYPRAYGLFTRTGEPLPVERLPLAKAVAGEPVMKAEWMIRRPDGTEVIAQGNAVPLVEADGRRRGAVLTIRDVTDQVRARERVEELNRTLEERVAERAAVAEERAAQLRQLTQELTQAERRERRRLAQLLHDGLQQLLVAAKLRIGMIRPRAELASDAEPLKQVDDLIDQSIRLSRSLTAQLSPPVLYEVGLGAALSWLGRWIEEQHGLRVVVRIAEDAEPEAEEVRALLFDAARELLFNVVKHAGVKEAELDLERVEDDRVRLAVVDRGVGYGDAPSSDGSRLGFGLLSIRERLGYLGGSLEVERPDGGGTRVVAVVSRRDRVREADREAEAQVAAVERAEAEAPEVRMAATDRAVRVLLADDHKILRQGLASLLREEPGLELVGEASDGAAAVEMTRRLKPDVVVMDVTMPKMTGVEATRRVKAEQPGVRVVGLSMHSERDMAAAMLNAGASAYLTKGGPAGELIRAIRGIEGG